MTLDANVMSERETLPLRRDFEGVRTLLNTSDGPPHPSAERPRFS